MAALCRGCGGQDAVLAEDVLVVVSVGEGVWGGGGALATLGVWEAEGWEEVAG